MYLVTLFLLAILFFVEWMIKLFMLPQTWKMVSLKRTRTLYTVHFALMMGCIWHVRMFLGRFISNLRKRQLLTLPTSSLLIPSVPLTSFSCPGAHFSKAPETFWARKAIAKSRTLRLQSCFIHIFFIWREVPFIQEVSGVYTSPFLGTV